MIYKEIILNSCNKDSVETEIMYEVAAARADGVELIKLYSSDFDDNGFASKVISIVTRRLKAMKQSGLIQFYAGKTDFKVMSMPAHFLINKYPDLFYILPDTEGVDYLYVKI